MFKEEAVLLKEEAVLIKEDTVSSKKFNCVQMRGKREARLFPVIKCATEGLTSQSKQDKFSIYKQEKKKDRLAHFL